MWNILGIGIGCLFISSLILPWIQRSQIQKLREELDALKKRVLLPINAEKRHSETDAATVSKPSSGLEEKPQHVLPSTHTPAPPLHRITPEALATYKTAKTKKTRIGFEQQFGARLPVWIGGVALALAGFFMVKYSIETGLLSPTVRVVLGIMFGVGLLYAANWMRSKPAIADGTRIAQALSGAGIAVLYISIFAATSLYALIPNLLGFAGMAGITATAVILSLRHGMPIALLGLVGGFMTPAMVGSNDPQAPILFIYLYFVLTGLMVVIRKQRWWVLAIPTVLGGFLWACFWIFGGHFTPNDTIYLGLFLLAVCATVVAISKEQYEEEGAAGMPTFKSASSLNYLTFGGALFLGWAIAAHSGFGIVEWGLFGLLSLGGIALAYFNQRLYGLVPWISMAVNMSMLVAWNAPDPHMFTVTLSLFGALYIVSGVLLQSRSERPLIWAGLTAAASLGYYLLGYFELRFVQLAPMAPMFWGMLALAFAGLGSTMLQNLLREMPVSHPQKQQLLAIYAGTTTAFLSLALTIELPREFLSVAIAAQLLAVCWINTQVDIRALRMIAGALAVVFAFLLMPQIMLLLQLTVYSLTEAQIQLQDSVPIVNWPMFQLGLPALFFAIGSLMLRKAQDDRLVRVLEVAAIALIGVMGYYLTRHAFHVDENVLFVKAGFVERGVITNILFLYGLACLWGGRHFTRQAISLCGIVLAVIAMFRIIYFDCLIYNPLWSFQTIGETPIFNALILSYGLPVVWAWIATNALPHAGKSHWCKYGYGYMLSLAFIYLTLNVRQLFHGTFLNAHFTSDAEIYSYSAVWLLFGVGLLFMGTLRKDKMIRIASLGIMILTVGKVFLVDASELEGLFRVFSFFGLGISLIALSWFYTRFVFGDRTQPEEPGE